MKRKIKTILGGALSMTLIAGCTAPSSSSSAPASSTVEETPVSEKQKEKNVSDTYTSLRKDNRFFVLEETGVVPFIESATGILVIADSTKEISEKYITLLDKALEENEVSCAYVESPLETGSILEKIKEHNDSGLEISDTELPTPLTLFINNGTIVYLDDESNVQWSAAMETELYSTLKINSAEIKKAQEENASTGCDTGCKLEG